MRHIKSILVDREQYSTGSVSSSSDLLCQLTRCIKAYFLRIISTRCFAPSFPIIDIYYIRSKARFISLLYLSSLPTFWRTRVQLYWIHILSLVFWFPTTKDNCSAIWYYDKYTEFNPKLLRLEVKLLDFNFSIVTFALTST